MGGHMPIMAQPNISQVSSASDYRVCPFTSIHRLLQRVTILNSIHFLNLTHQPLA